MRGTSRLPKLRRRRDMGVEVLEGRQLMSTITVNTTADDTSPDTTLSLREAIEVSNGTLPVSSLSTQEQAQVSGPIGSTNTIDFNIPKTDPGYNPATGVWTITPLQSQGQLPTISNNTAIIDGYSQPGASKNTLAVGDNAKLAVAIDGSQSDNEGLMINQPGTKVLGLDIENFKVSEGVVIYKATDVQIAGCFIGVDPTGETAAPDGDGVVIYNSSNIIGGPDVGDRNVISGNHGDGINLPTGFYNPLQITQTGNVTENNYIGVDAAGTKAIMNRGYGVEDFGSGDTYGGTAPGTGNVISGNYYGGLTNQGSITIEGNYVGTDATGHVALGNGSSGSGISDIEPTGATSITTIITDNVVSGNDYGVSVGVATGSQSTCTIAGNKIGTDVTGTTALGNIGRGLVVNGPANAVVQNNVISANGNGVLIGGINQSAVVNDVLQGNFIGTDKTGLVPLGNKQDGIDINGSSNVTIGGGGPGQPNVIANNGGYGINLLNIGQQDKFSQNSIFGNANAGILVLSVSNNGISPPVLTFTPGTGNSGTLSGTLTEAPNTTYVVEVFSNTSAPTTGQEQGQTFVKALNVTTDGSGKGSFALTEPTSYYTATATDPSGDTSGFSNAVPGSLPQSSQSSVALTSSLNPSIVGQAVTFTAVVSAPGYQGKPTGTVTFTIDGQAEPSVQLNVAGSQEEAQFVTSTLAAGQHTVTATYSGDLNVAGSNGSLPSQIVNKSNLPATTTTVGSSLNPSTVGQMVTFTAIVSPGTAKGTPAGTVGFTIDGHAEPPVALHKVNGIDEASFSIETLTAGNHTVTASYSGDPSFAGSVVTDPLIQQVSPPNHGGPPPADGPTVVSLDRFGIHMQPTVLVLTFNDGLDPATRRIWPTTR